MLLDIVRQLGDEIPKKQSLSALIGNRLRSLLQQGILEPGAQLPSEPEMAEALRVSRMTLRAALNVLEREGTIIRRQGVGTFLTAQLLLPNRLDLNLGVTENIQSMGMNPGISDVAVAVVSADEQWAGHLDVPVETQLVDVQRTLTANSRPAVATHDLFPLRFLEQARDGLTAEEFSDLLHQELSLYGIFERRLGLVVDYGVARIRPQAASARLAQQLGVPEGSALMHMEQIDYGRDGRPLLVSIEHHVPDVYEFTVYRKR
jgi:GntR family transcriptional regulator